MTPDGTSWTVKWTGKGERGFNQWMDNQENVITGNGDRPSPGGVGRDLLPSSAQRDQMGGD